MLTSPIEEIKNRLSIVDVVQEYVRLSKAGVNFRALCPFHSEKSPSFFVSPSRQTWHCFGGCSEGGDMFKFIMRAEGVEFGDALRLLAKKAGVELKQQSQDAKKWETERKRLLELLELACRFFEAQLAGSATGKEALAYVKGRGANDESIASWRLGYAPDSQKALHDFLLGKGFSSWELGRAGLLTHAEGAVYDRFRSRIMFPVFDLSGQVIGFGGRIFGKKDPSFAEAAEGEGRVPLAKYVNTSNTPVYDKSRVLYGLDRAKLEARRQDQCLLVEGYMDVILASQAGTRNVVATSGTALTASHLALLKRYSSVLLAAFDRDEAGEAATKRSITLAVAEGFRVRVVAMPAGKDPADVAAQDPAAWNSAVEFSQSIFDFSFETALQRHDKAVPEGKRAIAEELLPLIRKVPNSIEQAHWIQRLAQELQVPEADVRAELAKEQGESLAYSAASFAEPKKPPTRKELLEERLLSLLFRYPAGLEELQEDLAFLSVSSREILEGMRKNPEMSFPAFEEIFPPETVELLSALALKGEMEEDAEPAHEFSHCLQELKLVFLKLRLEELSLEIKRAEEARDAARLQELTEQFHALTKGLS